MAWKQNRFGDQPVLDIVKARPHWNLKLLASEIGVPYGHLYNAAHGNVVPSPELRRKLSRFLKIPIRDLFTEEARRAKYNEGMAVGGKNRWRGAA